MNDVRFNEEVFINQFPLVKRFVYHIVYYRALSKELSRRELKSEFWILTIDAHLLQAAILWCMVFGADGTNPTHWKQLSKAEAKSLQKSFRDGLTRQTGLTWPEWNSYWKQMTGFRNGFAAHRELNYQNPIPRFDTAMEVAYFYDVWIRRVISPASFAEGSLSLFAENLARSAASLARRLLEVD